MPTTPVPEKVPPIGVPVKVTHDALTHKGATAVIVGMTCRMNTLRVTGAELHPAEDATTVTPLGIKPGAAADQLTPIELVPAPEVITPGAATVHVYVYPAPNEGT